MTQKIWRLRGDFDKALASKLNRELGTPEVIGELLVKRGIHDFQSAKSFFRPDESLLHDPFLMKDMTKAVERLELAKQNNEKILIYGDYDVDGTCSVSLLEILLEKWGFQIECYQPDREGEGYGVSFKGIDYAKEHDCHLMIALDVGITACEQVDYANELGIDVIICDHHLPPDVLPNAKAILNPKQNACQYPFKELCGCAVGFKLMCAYEHKNFGSIGESLSCIDIVATATAADIVPLVEENRVITHLGLKKINLDPSTGLKALVGASAGKYSRSKELDSRSLVFQIAPRINAAGRLEHAKIAREIVSGKIDSLEASAAYLNKINTDRQEMCVSVQAEASAALDDNPYLFSQVVSSQGWNKGIVGIVASKLIEQKAYKPTIVLAENEEGELTGSARSIKNVSVYKALKECEDILEKFGGHDAAAGLTLKKVNLDVFKQRFDEACKAQLNGEEPKEVLYFDAQLAIADLEARHYRITQQFEPFGPQNLAPRFLAEDAVLVEKRLLKDAHIKITVCSSQNSELKYDALMWSAPEKFVHLPECGEPLNLIYKIEENDFRGIKSLQLMMLDFKV